MITRHYGEIRRLLVRDGDLCLFGGTSLWPSLPIRYWDNGYKWHQPAGWLPWKIGPWSHAEIAHYDALTDTLEGWGSVGGGPRKVPLSRLLRQYGRFGWAPFLGSDAERDGVIRLASTLWRYPQVDYPGIRQYIRTAFRSLYGERVDCYPYCYSCWEWVATVHELHNPAAIYASDLVRCAKFGDLSVVIP